MKGYLVRRVIGIRRKDMVVAMKKAFVFSTLLALGAVANAGIVEDVRNEALADKCLESVVTEMIQARSLEQTANIVAAAFLVWGEVGDQQKAMGCSGNIGQAAIAAGGDPAEVLEATAAGEGNGPLSAPAGLGNPGIIGGFASPS